MSLTKEDLAAIGNLIDEKLPSIINEKIPPLIDEKLHPFKEELGSLRKLFTTVVNIQVDILDKIELMDGHIKLIMFHLNLSPESREMKTTLAKVR